MTPSQLTKQIATLNVPLTEKESKSIQLHDENGIMIYSIDVQENNETLNFQVDVKMDRY